jgi:hypothetical protein
MECAECGKIMSKKINEQYWCRTCHFMFHIEQFGYVLAIVGFFMIVCSILILL